MTDGSNATTFKTLSDREIAMERVFDAPRELVFAAYTDPAHIPHWWGPRGLTTTVDTMDVRPGGTWRFVHRDQDGAEYGFHGEYREVVPPERLVSTFEFEGMPGHVLVDTATFTEVDGKTKVTVTSLFASGEDLQGMMDSGMEAGARESWDRLAELLSTLR
ncbi:MAG: SRPBCC family protein [Chloroflexia bacterium]|nr:SRPBCC family protein [Chloroflexia bacterium]